MPWSALRAQSADRERRETRPPHAAGRDNECPHGLCRAHRIVPSCPPCRGHDTRSSEIRCQTERDAWTKRRISCEAAGDELTDQNFASSLRSLSALAGGFTWPERISSGCHLPAVVLLVGPVARDNNRARHRDAGEESLAAAVAVDGRHGHYRPPP